MENVCRNLEEPVDQACGIHHLQQQPDAVGGGTGGVDHRQRRPPDEVLLPQRLQRVPLRRILPQPDRRNPGRGGGGWWRRQVVQPG